MILCGKFVKFVGYCEVVRSGQIFAVDMDRIIRMTPKVEYLTIKILHGTC